MFIGFAMISIFLGSIYFRWQRRLVKKELIGEGNFGCVFIAQLKPILPFHKAKDVAVKCPKGILLSKMSQNESPITVRI